MPSMGMRTGVMRSPVPRVAESGLLAADHDGAGAGHIDGVIVEAALDACRQDGDIAALEECRALAWPSRLPRAG